MPELRSLGRSQLSPKELFLGWAIPIGMDTATMELAVLAERNRLVIQILYPSFDFALGLVRHRCSNSLTFSCNCSRS